jgi:outer membrane immunogenic protein
MSRFSLRCAASLRPAAVGRATPLRIATAIFSLLVAVSANPARAADWPGGAPVLRGSLAPSFARWDGWQFGVLAAYGNMTTSLNTTTGPVFGAFVGYNWQWGELVLGLDFAYKYPSTLDASTDVASFKLVDYETLRGRAGYAFGPFLPYAVLGVAVGRFNFGNVVAGTFTGKDNAFDAGFVAGLGMDWAVTPSIFLRAEWEYISFSTINGIHASTNTGQIGGGVRF